MTEKQKPRQVVSTRVLEKISDKMVNARNKATIIEEAIQLAFQGWPTGAHCPSCKKLWPKKELGAKPNISVRINQEYKNKIDELVNPSKFLSAILCSSYGFCPVCEQKI